MKWPCATDSYPRPSHSKPFYLEDLSHRKETIANQYSDRPHPFASYSVTRINPLYVDETKVDSRYAYDTIDDEECTGRRCKTEYLHSSPLSDDSIAVLKRDPDFIRSILVSVRLGRCHQRGNGLTPIPEGKVDGIPRPIWPNDDSTDRAQSAGEHAAGKRERRHRQQRQARSHGSGGRVKNGAAPIRAERRADVVAPLFADAGSTAALLPPALAHILRELSHSINDAMENADRVEIPPDTVLRSLRAKINSCLETISAKEAAAYAADTVADLYERGSGDSGCVVGDRSVVATLSRAFSFVNAFHKDGSHRRSDHNGNGVNVNADGDGDDDDDVEKGRLMLLKRLGRFPPPAPSDQRTTADASYERLQRSSSGSASGVASASGSSSSCASTSGFSDLTHTPTSSNSSASDSPPASRSTESTHCAAGGGAILLSARTDDVYQQKRSSESSSSGVSGEGSASSGRVEAVLKNGCNDVKVVSSPSFASSFPYHAIPDQTTVSGDVPSRSGSTCGIVAKGIGCLAEAASIHSKTDTLLSSYPGHRCPDFTLDVQQAEKVMKKIQERKKERCWCRLVTSFVGFVFLLFSVMFFSMMFTRGDKMFGPL